MTERSPAGWDSKGMIQGVTADGKASQPSRCLEGTCEQVRGEASAREQGHATGVQK